ncbi:hypothetical protein A5643_15140 [Mycobacterium sp. 1274756.6]|nr:hypothetical protein A5643_15140 [Mycobacterium sp. 1274756.6]
MNLLDRVDYSDSFATAAPDTRTAEQWARLCFETDPPASLKLAFMALAPFRARSDAATGAEIAGLRIVENQPEHVVLGFDMKRWTPRIIFSAKDGDIRISTLIRFDGSIGRTIWGLLAPMHRNTVKSLIDHAAKVAAKASDDPS